MSDPTPPAYAWDWFTRQRLLWREVRSRLARSQTAAARRYEALDTRADVTALLRADYGEDPVVRDVVDRAVREVAFLGRTDASFRDIGPRNAPRGMRWWWSHLTGEEVGPGRPRHARGAIPETQLTIDEILSGYGDGRSGTSSVNRLPDSSGS